MTKLVSLRVVVAADDGVDLQSIKARLMGLIRGAGTEPMGEAGEAGQVFWVTADVLQGPEGRANPRRPAPKPRVVAGQGELA